MTRETYSVEIERGPVPRLGEYCECCVAADPGIEAEVTIIIAEDGGRRAATTRECCLDCVWQVIDGEHVADAAPHVLLHPGVAVPSGVYDPLAP